MAAFFSNLTSALPTVLWAGRILLAAAAVWVLLRCGISLFGRKEAPEVWGFVSLSNGARYDLTHWENMIGRMRSADVRVNFPSVSRCHAAICRIRTRFSTPTRRPTRKCGVPLTGANTARILLWWSDSGYFWSDAACRPTRSGAMRSIWTA